MIIDGECHVEAKQVHQLNKQPCCRHSNKGLGARFQGLEFRVTRLTADAATATKSAGS